MRPAPLVRLVVAVVLAWTAAPAIARAADATLKAHEVRGTIGELRVGAYLVVRGETEFVRGHYFYASRLKDIPLTGRIDGAEVTLDEPGGGVFRLHLFGNGSAAGQPLTFYNSVGLGGTWTRGAVSLPVTLRFDWDSGAEERFYGAVTAEADAAFEARVARFLHAATAGDRTVAADGVSYPLRVNAERSFVVRDRRDFLAQWNRLFPPRYLALLRTAIPHEMFVRNGMAMVGDGAAWFDAKGAVALNLPH